MTDVAPARILHLIDGEHRPASVGGWIDDIDPATATVHALVADGNADDVDAAVDAARRAFPAWRDTPAGERSHLLMRLADLLEADLDRFALAECVDNGKPLSMTRQIDIPRAVANLRFFATAILHTRGESYVTDAGVSGGGRAVNTVLRRPRGVAACISPWNLPLYLFTWKIAPALATGNTVVAKPSEVTPLTAFMLGELAIKAGFPPGVLNIVHGLGARVGAPLVAHPDVPAITFTGGTATGAEIARTAAPMFKKLSLELGGKNPAIIFDDCDLKRHLREIVRACFANQGQICLCAERLLVQRGILEQFVGVFIPLIRALRVSDPLEAATEQGALVSAAHLAKVQACIETAKAEGAVVLSGGMPPHEVPPRCENGYFLRPTVLTGLPSTCGTNQEEIFGPVVSIIPFDDEAEAIAIANDTRYGLAATVWTQDGARAQRVAAALDFGTVWINCWLLRDLRVPFGGTKASGVGREGGDEALRFFTEPTTVCTASGPAD